MRLPRASGVLLHPTSLPGPHGSGDCGEAAYHFVDFLASAGQRLWQVLPLAPPGAGHSPYAARSTFAGNPLLISPELLRDELAHHGGDLGVEPPGLGRGLEAVRGAVAVLGDLHQRVPVDAALEVEPQVFVVREEARHGGSLVTSW